MFGNDIVRLNKDIERIDSNAAITEENVDHIINGAEIVPDDNGILHIPYWARVIYIFGYARGTLSSNTNVTMLDKKGRNVCRFSCTSGKEYHCIEGKIEYDPYSKKTIDTIYNTSLSTLPSTSNTMYANTNFFWNGPDVDISELSWSGAPEGLDLSNLKYSVFA